MKGKSCNGYMVIFCREVTTISSNSTLIPASLQGIGKIAPATPLLTPWGARAPCSAAGYSVPKDKLQPPKINYNFYGCRFGRSVITSKHLLILAALQGSYFQQTNCS